MGNKDLTLKDIVQYAKKYLLEVYKYKWIILMSGLPFAAYLAYEAYNSKPTYTAFESFLLNESSTSLGGLDKLLGTIGVSAPSKSSEKNPDQIIEVAKSSPIVWSVLFATNKATNNLVINDIITIYELDEEWSENNPKFAQFKFKKVTEIKDFTREEAIAFKRISSILTGSRDGQIKGLLNYTYFEDSNIFMVLATTLDENLSLELVSKQFNELQYYYGDKKLSDQKTGREQVANKVDSLNRLLKGKEMQLAQFENSNRNLVSYIVLNQKQQLVKDIQFLTVSHEQAKQSLEMIDFGLKNDKPFFKLLDESFPPLNPQVDSFKFAIIKGLFIGILLATLFIIARRMFLDALK